MSHGHKAIVKTGQRVKVEANSVQPQQSLKQRRSRIIEEIHHDEGDYYQPWSLAKSQGQGHPGIRRLASIDLI